MLRLADEADHKVAGTLSISNLATSANSIDFVIRYDGIECVDGRLRWN